MEFLDTLAPYTPIIVFIALGGVVAFLRKHKINVSEGIEELNGIVSTGHATLAEVRKLRDEAEALAAKAEASAQDAVVVKAQTQDLHDKLTTKPKPTRTRTRSKAK